MADGTKKTSIEVIQKAILDYHMGGGAAQNANAGLGDKLKGAAFEGLARLSAGADGVALTEQLKSHPNVSRFLASLDQNSNGQPLDKDVAYALVQRWKKDPKMLDNLEAMLPGENETDPEKDLTGDSLTAGINDPKHKSEIIKFLGDLTKPLTKESLQAATAPTPNPTPTPTPTPTPKPNPNPSGEHGSVGAPPRAEAKHRGGPSGGASLPVPNNHINEFADALAKAGATYGIPPEKIQGFVRAVREQPELREKISQHLQRKPDLVGALNNFSKIDGRDVPEIFRSALRETLEEIYDDPAKLANPEFTQNFSSNTAKLMKLEGVRAGIARREANPGLTTGGGPPAPRPGGSGAGGASNPFGGVTDALGGIMNWLNDPNLGAKFQGFMDQLKPILQQIQPLLMQLLNMLGGAINGMGGSGTLRMAGGPDGGMSQRLGVHGGTTVDPHSGATTAPPVVARHDGPAGQSGHAPGQRVVGRNHDRVQPPGPGTLTA